MYGDFRGIQGRKHGSEWAFLSNIWLCLGDNSVPHGCPCGYFSDTKRECRCSSRQIATYRNKISGPLLDRIDIHIEVPSMDYQELSGLAKGESSSVIRQRTTAARGIQKERFARMKRVHWKRGQKRGQPKKLVVTLRSFPSSCYCF